MRKRNKCLLLSVGAILFTAAVIGSVYSYTKRLEPLPPAVKAPAVDALDPSLRWKKDASQPQKEWFFDDRLRGASEEVLKDEVKETKKSLLERFLWGDEDEEEQ